ncbi:MAG TPA: ATP-binding protein [Flavipsychrobacter sp.]|nr:ATP-binding protein [Flavipsychrobacter sp.]
MKKRLRLIFIAFCVSFAIMASLSLFALKQFSSLIENSEEVDHSYNLISKLYELGSLTKEVDIKERGYIITGDSLHVNEMQQYLNQMLPAANELEQYIKGDSNQLRLLSQLRAILITKRDLVRDNLKYLDTAQSKNAASPFFYEGRTIRGEAEMYMDKMRQRAYETLKERAQVKIYYQEVTFSTIRYLLTIFAFVTLVLFFFMIRELKQRMRYQDELQMKMRDLKRSHAELEQIAYAVSHDLQEPLRKIQIFSNRTLYVKKDSIDDESKTTLERINSSATRMHDLIGDLMNLTSLVKEEHMEEIELNQLLQLVLSDLDERIAEKKAEVHIEALPTVTGHHKQLQLLFRSLLDNALKFSKEEKTPIISIRYDRVNGSELREYGIVMSQPKEFCRITIADNGIGFEDKFIKKMFQIFQSLHTKQSEYSGKGIGLAICQRVMVNHGGYIIAHGRPDIGATFKLYFPVQG